MIPILIPAAKKPDGVAAVGGNGQGQAVWLVPANITDLVLGRPADKALRKFGGLSNVDRSGLFALAQLLDATRGGDKKQGKIDAALAGLDATRAELSKQRDRNSATRELWQPHLRRAVAENTIDVAMDFAEAIYGRDVQLGREVRFCMWESDGIPDVGLLAPGLGHAIALHLMLAVRAAKSVAICERCKASFIRQTPWQLHCSARCANAERQARKRARKKAGKYQHLEFVKLKPGTKLPLPTRPTRPVA